MIMPEKTKYRTNVAISINIPLAVNRISQYCSWIKKSMCNRAVSELHGNYTEVYYEEAFIEYYSEKLSKERKIIDAYLESHEVNQSVLKRYKEITSDVQDILDSQIIAQL